MNEYICLSGDCDNFALEEPGCFVVIDAAGRQWLCYEPQAEPGVEFMAVKEIVKAMQHRAFLLGMASEGTRVSVVVAKEWKRLEEWLARS